MSRIKTQVVCDTMIWYEIAKGNIVPEEHPEIDFVATGINIIELSSSENIVSNFPLVKDAIAAMYKHHSTVIAFEPWDHILVHNSSIQHESFSSSALKDNLNALSAIMSGRFDDEMAKSENANFMKQLIDEFNAPSRKFTTKMNEALVNDRRRGAKIYGKRKNYVRKLQEGFTFNEIRRLILDILANIKNMKREEMVGKIEWNNIELFFLTWDMYFKEKTIIANGKFHHNDFYDLLNLSYDGKGDKYWTLEKHPWLRLMSSNPNTMKYLYKP